MLCAAFAICGAIGMNAGAQVRFNLNVNIGSQPTWGPVGYNHVDYYYLPDIEAYYYVPRHQFIYMSNGHWIYSYSLPPAYSNYDLYSGYKVVVNRPMAYMSFDRDRAQYGRYRGYHGRQQMIRYYNRPGNMRDRDRDRRHHDNGHHNRY